MTFVRRAIVLTDSEVIEETFRTAQSSCAPRETLSETRPQSPEPNICTYDGGCYASLHGCKILEHYLKPTLETCDPANERSVICDGATANRAFFENGGYRGQSCGDRDVLTQWFHDLHFGEVGDDLGQFGWAFHDLGLLEEDYVHTWDREAYLRAIATEPRWMEVLDRLCADRI